VNRMTRVGRLVMAIGVIWFVLGFTTSAFLLATGMKGSGGHPVRVQAPIRYS
jgi:hypothetical protein